jgi:hypothetical protein
VTVRAAINVDRHRGSIAGGLDRPTRLIVAASNFETGDPEPPRGPVTHAVSESTV